MENGKTPMFGGSFPFTIYHFPFSIQAGIFQRPARASRGAFGFWASLFVPYRRMIQFIQTENQNG